MRSAFHFYARFFAVGTVAGLAAVATINLLVDPLGAYPLFSLKAIEPYRPQLLSHPAKAEMLLRSDCEVLLLGTSRVQVGLPVKHPAYGTTSVCNMGLAGTTLTEISGVLQFALRHDRPKRVLLGVDFILFSDVRGLSANFENSRFNPELAPVDYHFKNVLGSQMLEDSWMLLFQWLRGVPQPTADRGFLSKSVRPGISQRESFARGIRKFLTEPEIYGAYRYSEQRLDVFRQMVRRCRKERVDLIVFIPPVHALELETVRVAGLWPVFEQWKGDLARILAEEGMAQSAPLWDFTGFTGPVAEAVPPPGNTTARMHWYLENSHFTAALGEIVLNRLLSDSAASSRELDFGKRLTTHNLAAHLAQLQRERETYATAQPAEIAWVNRLATEVRGNRFTTDANSHPEGRLGRR